MGMRRPSDNVYIKAANSIRRDFEEKFEKAGTQLRQTETTLPYFSEDMNDSDPQ